MFRHARHSDSVIISEKMTAVIVLISEPQGVNSSAVYGASYAHNPSSDIDQCVNLQNLKLIKQRALAIELWNSSEVSRSRPQDA